MATITDIRPVDLYWLSCNYNQGMLQTLYNGGDASGVISPFKYTNDKSTSTDLHDVFFNIVIDHYIDARFGEYEAHNVSINYRLRDAQIEEIAARGKDIEEIVTYYDNSNTLLNFNINSGIDEITQRQFYYIEPSNKIRYFKVMIKFTDGTITDFSINWGLDLINCTYSNYRNEQGGYVDGFPWVLEGDRVRQAYTWINGNNDSKGAVNGVYGNYEQKTAFRLSHKAFQSHADALAYLKYGIDNSLDEDSGESDEPAEDRLTTLYYQDTVIRRGQRSAVKEDWFKHSIKFEIQYKKNDGTLITPPRMSIVGYVTDLNQSTFSNINWVYADGVKVKESKWSYGEISGSQHHGENPPDSIPEVMCFYGNTTIAPYEFESKYYTNMKIFANEEDARAFLNGDKTRIPLYDGANGKIKGDGVGDPIIYNTQAEGGAHSSMSECWLMTQSQLDNLASIFTSNLTLAESQSSDVFYKSWTSFVRGLDMYNNPIDMVCDLFWLPINISEYAIFSDRTEWTVSGEENGSAGSGVWADPFASGQNKLFNLHPNYGQGTLYESLKAEADAKVEQLNDYAQQGGIPVVNRRTGEAETIPLIIQGGAQ